MNEVRDILSIEDNPADARLIQMALEGSDLPVRLHGAPTGRRALRLLREEGLRPSLVLLDLRLSDGSGLDVLQEVKSNEDLRAIPVVVFSSSDAPEDVQGAYSRDANGYVRKPDNLDAFVATLQSLARFWVLREAPAD